MSAGIMFLSIIGIDVLRLPLKIDRQLFKKAGFNWDFHKFYVFTL